MYCWEGNPRRGLILIGNLKTEFPFLKDWQAGIVLCTICKSLLSIEY
jgi:hypothetical protein